MNAGDFNRTRIYHSEAAFYLYRMRVCSTQLETELAHEAMHATALQQDYAAIHEPVYEVAQSFLGQL